MAKIKAKFGLDEIDTLLISERVSAVEIAERIRLNTRSNILDAIDIKLTPYLRFPLELIGDSFVHWIFVIGPTQCGKSVFLQAFVADSIMQDPGTLLYVLPDEKSGRRQLKEKIIDMILATPELRARTVAPYQTNLALTQIRLDNMTIYPAWSNSIATMNSTPCKRVAFDEIRLMKLELGNESNALKQGGDRLTTYMSMGMGQGAGVSTPSVRGDLLHGQMYVPGTAVLFWKVPCPSCGEYQKLDFFDHLLPNVDANGQAHCLCQFCKAEFTDTDKKVSWNGKGVYSPFKTHVYRDGSLETPLKPSRRYVVRFDSMVSPFRSFQLIYEEYKRTVGKLHDYKNFYQAWLARFWVNDVSKTSKEGLEKRKLEYLTGTVPNDCKIITAGIDTQDSGFYVTVRGWGDNKRTWLIDAFFLEAPIYKTREEELLEYFRRDINDRVYTSAEGIKWKIAMIAIDRGGHRTKELDPVLAQLPKFVGVMGRNSQAQPMMYGDKNDCYYIRTAEYLDETEQKCQLETFLLPSNVSEDYLMQFLNVRRVDDRNKKTGETKSVWKKMGQCDYRYAEVHAFICMDIPNEYGTFRRRMEDPEFKFNPVEYEFQRGSSEGLLNRTAESGRGNSGGLDDPYYSEGDGDFSDTDHQGSNWF